MDNLDQLLAELNSSSPAGGSPASPRSARAPSPSRPPASPGKGPQGGGAAPKPSPENDDSSIRTGIRGAVDSITFGLGDELVGAAQSIGLSEARDQRESVWSSDRSFGDILAGNIAKNRQMYRNDEQQRFKSRTAGQVVGALAIPFGAGARGALQVAKVGAIQGAAYGAGSGEGLADRAKKAVEFGVGGAVIGGVVGKVVEKAAPAVRRLLGREAKAAPAEAAIPEETVEGWTQPDIHGERSPVPLAREAEGAEEMVPLHAETPEGTPAGEAPAGESLGSISRAGLTDLQERVAGFKAHVESTNGRAVDVTPTSPEHPSIGAFRLGNLGDGPDTMSLLGALTRQLPSKGPKTDAELLLTANQAAKDMGTDPEAIHALAREMVGPLGDADNAIATLRTVQRQAADDVDLFHGSGIDWSTATDEMVQQAGQAIYNVQRLNELVMSAKAGVGRALRVFQLPNSEAYFESLAKRESLGVPGDPERSIPPLPTTREEMADWFELWGMGKKDPQFQSDFLSGTLSVPSAGHYLLNSFANSFTASILSAPKTIILNMVGPAVINTVRSLERMGGGALGAVNPFATAADRAASLETAKQTPLALFHTLGDIRDVFQYGVQAFKENHTVLGGGGTVRNANVSFGPYNANLLKAASVDPTWMEQTGYTLGNAINLWPKALARVNAGLDEFAKRLTYLNETRLRAQVEAAGLGLEGDEAKAHVQQVLANSFDEAGAATREDLLRAAERTTLTYAPGGDTAEGSARLDRKFTTAIQTLRRDYPLTRFILPVFNVPANAVGETLRRIPLYNRMPWMSEHAADLAGDNGAVSQAEAHGRSLLGGSFLMAGYLMNQAGLLTGAGPQDPTDAKIWRQTHEPYSLRVGDTWVSYRKLDILGGLLSIPATISDLSVYHKVDDRSMGEVMLTGVGSLATWFKDQASMRTATQLLSLGDSPLKDPAKAVESLFGQILAGSIPASGLIRTLGVDTTDPYSRMRRSWDDYVKSGIPGLSEELEPLRNVLGEPVNRPANSLGEAVFPVTMAPVATYKREPVLDELSRLYSKTGYGAGADPRSLLYGYDNPQDIPLEDGKSLYFHAMQSRATMKLDGKTLKQTLGDLIETREYNEAVDADASQSVTSRGDRSRAYMVRQVFVRWNKAIKAELGAGSPKALKYLTAAAAKQRDDAYLGSVSIGQLVENPDLYRTNGVDPRPYEEKITEGAAGDLLQALQR